MKYSSRFLLRTFTTAVAAFMLLSGCGSKESKLYGTYEDSKEPGKLVLQAEHKATFSMGNGPAGDITWEMAGDDKITVNVLGQQPFYILSDGNLRDGEGTIWKRKK